ncbi:MAG: Protein translocase subunit SecD [Parcubacteria group bacterium Gr01-1014_18]|nr:MAG: Protein translocase subunit SecD [Parcubacteria group bacterium Greene0416_36]TSC81585.1 MAG: Protein translocase subunit SecD [Parcubacteria group bacterium Gr01-1014_18]TSC99604.1 MAG: Protein translocase subunit SecD [Parcubacteria group bacterium Greene1014_20]TSD07055.1 MAG: Protein translocase subunit SecD [Parcubacteria group bacterium Greene0714_2]
MQGNISRFIFAGKGEVGRARRIVLAVFLLSFCLFFFVYPGSYEATSGWIKDRTGITLPAWKSVPFKEGLDLLGGTDLMYQADLSLIPDESRSEAMSGVRDIIEKRVNSLGVSEPLVQVSGADRLVVQLAGVKDVKQAIDLIGQTPLLEFKEEGEAAENRTLSSRQEKELKNFNDAAKKKLDDFFVELNKGKKFEDLVPVYSSDESSKAQGGLWGFFALEDLAAEFQGPVGKFKLSGEVSRNVVDLDTEYNVLKLISKRDAVAAESNHILICYKGAESCDKEFTKEEAKAKIDELKKQATAANFEQLVKDNSTEPGAANSAGYLGFMRKGKLVPEFEGPLFSMKNGQISEVVETVFGYHLIYKKSEKKVTEYELGRIMIPKKTRDQVLGPADPWKNTGLSGAQLSKATLEFDTRTGAPQVGIVFDSEGRDLFKELTKRNIGKSIAIFLDGSPISTPRVNEPIIDGSAVISGNFSIAEAKELVSRLNSGALPVPVTLLTQQTIGASLGQDSVNKSVFAGMVGLIIVCVFMVLYYRLAGLVASLALIVYTILTLAVFKWVGVTLTLSGIAGFVLSIGMAVDANILIYERLKEELRSGRGLRSAMDIAFSRAWFSIRDSNFSSILTCVILIWMGTGLIKGFAITLMIGVLVSMFTAITVTRFILRSLAVSAVEKRPFLFLGSRRK